MKQVIDFLREWAFNYVKNKDIFTRTIVEIEQKEKELFVRHKHKEHKYFIDPFLENYANDLKSLKEDSHASIVCFNTAENFDLLIKNWNEFIIYRHLNVIFFNPNAIEQKVWVIFPYTHNNIADPDSLRLGLQTMFEQVGAVDRKSAERFS